MFKNKNGMTFIEVMTAVVIIAILVGIAIPNLIAPAKKRSIDASIKTNMRTFQVMLETYRVDNLVYPDSVSELEAQANAKSYNKKVRNPVTNNEGSVTYWAVDFLDPSDSSFDSQKASYQGRVGYQKINNTKYYINGYSEGGMPILENNTIYLITNGG
ncbi:MAG: type II secretion system protein [Candidatus Sericytochromatia bacterium]